MMTQEKMALEVMKQCEEMGQNRNDSKLLV